MPVRGEDHVEEERARPSDGVRDASEDDDEDDPEVMWFETSRKIAGAKPTAVGLHDGPVSYTHLTLPTIA